MPFNIMCVRCGTKIATVEMNKVRDWTQTHDVEICKGCVEKEEKLREFFEKQKKGYIKRLDVLCQEAVTELDKKVKELAHAEYRPTD
jgi:hypothetical protein